MILGIHCPYNHCVEDVIMNVCLQKLLPYPLMYADSWEFFYDSINSMSICDFGGHEYKKKIPHKETIEKYVGLKIYELHNVYDWFMEINTVEQIAIYCDSYYCDWTESFYLHHQPHCFFGKGRIGDRVVISDPYLNKCNREIAYYDLLKGKAFAIKFIEQPRRPVSYKTILEDSLSNVEKALQSLETYCSDFSKKSADIDSTREVLFHPLYQNITYIANSRYNYSTFLNYISQKMQDDNLYYLAREFYVIGFEWTKVKDLCARMILDFSERKKQKIKNALIEILRREKSIYTKIK